MPRILIVEDDPLMADNLALHLEQAGYEVVGQTDKGEDGIELTRSLNPDLVMMDIVLKGEMDGIEAAELISSQFDKPVLYLTGYDEQTLFERAKITSPFAYLLKPFNERELKLTIEVALERHELERRLRESDRHFKEAQIIGGMGSWEWDIVNNVLDWSDHIYRIFGTEPQSFGTTYEAFVEFIMPEDRGRVKEAVNAALNEHKPYDIEHRIIRPDGEERYVREQGLVEFNDAGEPVNMLGTVQDVTDRKRDQETIERLAFTDTLTGLPNRNLFYDRLTQAFSHVRRYDDGLAVMMIDLDGFKAVNDTFGHETGDHLLAEVGKRIQKYIRETDTAARIGGDEFGFILPGVKSNKDVIPVAEKLCSTLSKPMTVDGHEINIGASIGISLWITELDDIDSLMKRADKAMYEAKAAGKNCYRFFSD